MIIPAQNRVFSPADEWGLLFDGSSYVTVPHSNNFLNLSGLSFSFFLNRSGLNEFGRIFEKGSGNGGASGFSVSTTYSGGTYRLRTGINATLRNSTAQLSLNRFYHVAVVFNSVGTLKIYIDGALDSEQETTALTNITTTNPLRIGMSFDFSHLLVGRLSNFAIFNRAISLSEIRYYQTHRLTGREPGLIGYWPMYRDASSLTRLPEISNNKNDGTITGAMWTRSIERTNAVAPANVRLATLNGEAMLWVEGLDLSNYAGALGITPWEVELTDGAGVKARGYVAGKGGGLALGSELVTNGDFSSITGWTLFGTASIADGKLTLTGNGTFDNYAQQLLTSNHEKSICKLSYHRSGEGGDNDLYSNAAFGGITHDYLLGEHTKYINSYSMASTGNRLVRTRNTLLAGVRVMEYISLIPLTDVPETGIHLVSTYNGNTRNMASLGTDFNPNNVASIRFRLVNEVTFPVTAANVRLATRDGESMLWIEGMDLGDFAGDLGNTAWMATLTDNVGVKATAYCAGKGGGLALGSELVVNGDFETDLSGWTIADPNALVRIEDGSPAGGGSWCVLSTRTSGLVSLGYQDIVGNSGSLYFGSVWQKSGVSSAGIQWDAFSNFISNVLGLTEWTHRNAYRTYIGTGTTPERFRLYKGGDGRSAYYDQISLKKVTDIPETGLRLVSALNGNTRNMESIGTDFNPNNIISITFRRVK